MVTYKVLNPGFYNGAYYSPFGKRPVLRVAEPLKVVPSWLELAPEKQELAPGVKRRLSKKMEQEEEPGGESEVTFIPPQTTITL